MKYFCYITFGIILVIFAACQDGFPTQDKANLPKDHTDSKEGIYHKIGASYPYSYDNTWQSSCAGTNCHKSDLKGGLVKLDNVYIKSPSCYQCHGKLWHQIDTAYNKLQRAKL